MASVHSLRVIALIDGLCVDVSVTVYFMSVVLFIQDVRRHIYLYKFHY